MRKIITISMMLMIALLSACEKDYFEVVAPPDLSVQVSFSKEIIPIFKANCYGSGCHDKGIAPDLTEANAYDQLTMLGYVDTTNAEKCGLYLRITSKTKPMPPKGLMSGETTNKILAWIKQGAQNN